MEVEEQDHQNPMQKEKQKQRLWDWMEKILHNEHITPSNDVQRLFTPSQTPARPQIERRTSSKVCVGLPRPSTTFQRHQDELRKTLEPAQPSDEEIRVSSIARQPLGAALRPQASEHLRGERSASQSGYHPVTAFSLNRSPETGSFANPSLDKLHQMSPSLPLFFHPLQGVDPAYDVASEASYDNNKTVDEELEIELAKKWILNLSMHFRDKSPRENFFVTYAETHEKWGWVTIPCDYHDAEVDSLEADLQSMSYQREKSSRIYEELNGCLDNIQFYDTITNDGLVSTSENKTDSRVAATHRLRRRGRGSRRNKAYWTKFNTNAHEDFFNGRDCLFAGKDGKVNRPAIINLDSGLKIPGGLIMSRRYAKDLGKEGEISQDYKDPGLRDVSGNITPTNGILRNQSFRISGTSVTFIRDVYICETIDDIVDVMAGVDFICAQFNLLFGKVKNLAGTFATWFSTTKESKKEKEKREWNEREQDIKAIRREIARYQRQREALLQTQQASSEIGRRVMEYRIEVNRSEMALLQIEEGALLRAQQASRGAASSR